MARTLGQSSCLMGKRCPRCRITMPGCMGQQDRVQQKPPLLDHPHGWQSLQTKSSSAGNTDTAS